MKQKELETYSHAELLPDRIEFRRFHFHHHRGRTRRLIRFFFFFFS